jgi:uncharacterized membrane protein YgcG
MAHQLSFLAQPPPPPPARLLRGRQLFLSEAVRLREANAGKRKGGFVMPRSIKWASVLVALMLVFGAVFGAGQAAAASLPGQFLYEVKLAAEQVRLSLTNNPEARAELNLVLAERRLNEIAELVEQGTIPDASVFDRASEQLESAMEPVKNGEEQAPDWAFARLKAAIQRQKRDMENLLTALPEAEQTPGRALLRVMNSWEKHEGVGDPSEAEREQNREGTPPSEEELPDPKRDPGQVGVPQPPDDSDPGVEPEPVDSAGSGGQSGQGPGAGTGGDSGAGAGGESGDGGSGSTAPGFDVTPQPQDRGQPGNSSPGPEPEGDTGTGGRSKP